MPLSFGGPYLGFMTCKKAMMREAARPDCGPDHRRPGQPVLCAHPPGPGTAHPPGEGLLQHLLQSGPVRPDRFGVYLAAMGPRGPARRWRRPVHSKAHYLAGELAKLGFSLRSGERPFFHEFVTDCPMDPASCSSAKPGRNGGFWAVLPVDGGILWCCHGAEHQGGHGSNSSRSCKEVLGK